MFKKINVVALILAFPLSSLAQGSNYYVGAFGGGGYSSNGGMTQNGIAFFDPSVGGALDVHARGHINNKSVWIAGVNAGYEFNGWALCAGGNPWCLTPAAEFEGYYLNNRISGDLDNPTARLPEHLFHNSFKMNTGVLLANSVWSIKSPCTCLQPYVGVGVGAAIISLYDADSLQFGPPEFGVNHFNSGTSDNEWTFAAQAKAGLRFEIARNVKLFAEYRYLYLAPTNYRFGSTQYPTHAPTSKWGVRVDSMNYNMGVAGIEYTFEGC